MILVFLVGVVVFQLKFFGSKSEPYDVPPFYDDTIFTKVKNYLLELIVYTTHKRVSFQWRFVD